MTNVLDRFNRPNGPIGNADSGQAWQAPADGNQWDIINNAAYRARGTSTSWAGSDIWIDTGSPDSLVEGTVVNNVTYLAFLQRGVAAGGAHLLTFMHPTFVALYFATSAYNYFGLVSFDTSIVAGDRMGSLVVGQRWQVFKNGVSVGLYDLANNPVFATLTSGRHGITSYYAKYPTVIFDDVAIKTPVKTYTGAAWQNHMAKVWDGTKWVTRAARRYDGTNWK